MVIGLKRNCLSIYDFLSCNLITTKNTEIVSSSIYKGTNTSIQENNQLDLKNVQYTVQIRVSTGQSRVHFRDVFQCRVPCVIFVPRGDPSTNSCCNGSPEMNGDRNQRLQMTYDSQDLGDLQV